MPATPPDDFGLMIDRLLLDTAATDAAGALLVAQADVVHLGRDNALTALKDGQGPVFHALTEAIELQVLVAAFERDHPGADGWKASQQAITDDFGDDWAQQTLVWVLRIAGVKTSEPEPGGASLTRWALALPVMGNLLPALDDLLASRSDETTQAVRDAIFQAVEQAVDPTWLQRILDLWTDTTGGPEITLRSSCERVQ